MVDICDIEAGEEVIKSVKMKSLLIFLSLMFLCAQIIFAQKVISAQMAYQYIGKTVIAKDTVYGLVNSHYAQLFEIYLGTDKPRKHVAINLSPAVGMGDRYIGLHKDQKNLFGSNILVKGIITGTKDNPVIMVNDTLQFLKGD